MKHWFGLCAALTVVAAVSHADIPRPDQTACRGKQVGDACRVEPHGNGTPVDGVCTTARCSRMGPDGVRTYECVRCIAPPPKAPAPTENQAPEGSSVPTEPADRERRVWYSLGIGLLALGASLGLSNRIAQTRRRSWS